MPIKKRRKRGVATLPRLAFYDNVIVWSVHKKHYHKSAEAAPRQARAN